MPYYPPPAAAATSVIQPLSQVWYDDFSTDRTSTDYDLAGGGNIVVSSGSVRVSVTGAEGQIVPKATKYTPGGVSDGVAQLKVSPVSTVTGSILNLIFNTSGNNVLFSWDLGANTWTSFKNLATVVTTSSFTEVGSYTPTAGTPFWVRWMRKGGLLVALIYTVDPRLNPDTVPVKGVYQTVAGPADTTPLRAGFSLQAAATGNLLADDFRAWV